MAYFIGIHCAGTAQSLPLLESLGYIIRNVPALMALPKTSPSLHTSLWVKAAGTTASGTGSEQAGPGEVQNELCSESAEQRDGPRASAGIPHGLSHRLGWDNKSTR